MRAQLNRHLAKIGLYWKAWDELTPFWQGYVVGTLEALALSLGAWLAWNLLGRPILF